MHKSYKAVSLPRMAASAVAIGGAVLALGTAPLTVRAQTAVPTDTQAVVQPVAQPISEYKIQPGDVLSIAVWKEQELQAEALVRPDGGLSFPLAGDVHVAGQTVTQLQSLLIERLRQYIPDPVVMVAIKAIGGSRIYVLGKVNRPGEYPLYRPLDVMQVLSLAGGTTPYAAVNDIEILRREDGKQMAIAFRYGDIEKGKALEQNILLRSGDTVVVP